MGNPAAAAFYNLGVPARAFKNAASWATDGDGNQEEALEHARAVVRMLDDGDPQAYDYLPRQPDLSGEFADDPTPDRLYQEITGQVVLGGRVDDMHALCDAYEAGVSDTFIPECERVLRAFLA